MKRIIILLLTLLMLVGCDNTNEIEITEIEKIPMVELVPAKNIIFYRSINSNIYHVSGCMYLEKILEENLLEFLEIDEDLRRCYICNQN